MPSAQQIRAQIENQLANRIPSALTPAARLVRENLPTGLPSVDAMLGGGLPLGAMTEVIGDPSSGRTTFAMSVLANVNRSGHVCAWIDASDEFDPVSAATIGINLPQLLLVRCGVPAKYSASQKKATDKLPFREPLETATTKPAGGGGSPHPRNEVRGLGKAVGELFQQKLSERNAKPGTPSANNIRLGKVSRNEQVASDRLPPRRAENLARQYPIAHPGFEYLRRPTSHKPTLKLEQERIKQAIKVTDLLLHNGGFRAIVLDLASFSPALVSRIPLATWFRFRALADSTHACLLLLTQHPCAKSSAELSLRLTCEGIEDASTVMTGVSYRASIVKHFHSGLAEPFASFRKPPQAATSADWYSKAAWAVK